MKQSILLAALLTGSALTFTAALVADSSDPAVAAASKGAGAVVTSNGLVYQSLKDGTGARLAGRMT